MTKTNIHGDIMDMIIFDIHQPAEFKGSNEINGATTWRTTTPKHADTRNASNHTKRSFPSFKVILIPLLPCPGPGQNITRRRIFPENFHIFRHKIRPVFRPYIIIVISSLDTFPGNYGHPERFFDRIIVIK